MAEARPFHTMQARHLLIVALAVFAVASAPADEATRALQDALRREGFFLGEVDGQAGEETRAAIRRFQIRNGLEVTGEPDAETRRALGLADTPSPAQPPPVPSPAAPGSSSPPAPSNRSVPAEPPRRTPPDDRPASPAPRSLEDERLHSASALASLYRGTVYATAPVVVRVDVLRTAQSKLRSLGLYDGDIDGLPGPATTRAIANYQRRRQIPETGRLDMDTLHLLGLLPRVIPGPPGRYGPPPSVPPPYLSPPQVPPALW